jgi:UDP-N-acetylglucosamine--N-acetylmuramyl-(pentapeptide) pyrophosphoryl-undecaprenol N-acetylglucosamine transferase
VYPALSILQSIGNRASEVLWVGSEGGMEADLVATRGIPFLSVPAAGVHGVGISKLPGNIIKLIKGIAASQKILRQFKPDVLLFTGGFVAVPMALAGVRVNSLLYVPDIEPGLAIRTLARYSDKIALTAANSIKYFKSTKKLVITGYPTRDDFTVKSKEESRRRLGLKNTLPVLLVIGGSKGAHLINEALLPNLPVLLQIYQVVHLSGTADLQECQDLKAKMLPELSQNYHPYAYLHDEISDAFSSADLAISRAGASVLGELPMVGLPAILVPYPFAWRYQKVNADYLADKGASIVVNNSELKSQLVPLVNQLFVEKSRLSSMSKIMASLATPQAASKLADLVCSLGSHPEGGRK